MFGDHTAMCFWDIGPGTTALAVAQRIQNVKRIFPSGEKRYASVVNSLRMFS